MPEVSLERWQAFLEAHPDAHFLQTGAWGELKARFGWDVHRLIVGDAGAQILLRPLPLGLTLAYIPKLAQIAQSPHALDSLWREVDLLCGKRHGVLCKIEPDGWMNEHEAVPLGAQSETSSAGRPSPHCIQPRRTIVVDLRGPETLILERMKQKCRYNIKLAEKKGVRVETWDDIEGFHRMLLETGKRDAFAVHSADYYRRVYELFRAGGMCELMVAKYAGEPLAALMVLARGRRAWYVYGGSTDRERERMPNYLLQWEAMRWARDHHCEEYDLWGVPDEDEPTLEAGFQSRSDGLWGVYRFKRGFGGELRRAPQAVDRVYLPWLYALYVQRMRGDGAP
jgi:lipid II:glycine glycyltransferase (peptidoglycan interpeptide bridge formation enzyme)